jgi:hypothetical protein
MEGESISGETDGDTKAPLKRIKKVDMEFIAGVMEVVMRDIGKMENKAAKVSMFFQMGRKKWGNGIKVVESNGSKEKKI